MTCDKLKEGESCTLEKGTTKTAGTCQMGERCGIKYGGCDSGGGPCGTTCSPALVCKECTTNCPSKDEGGCSFAPGRPASTSLLTLLLAALLALGSRRRCFPSS